MRAMQLTCTLLILIVSLLAACVPRAKQPTSTPGRVAPGGQQPTSTPVRVVTVACDELERALAGRLLDDPTTLCEWQVLGQVQDQVQDQVYVWAVCESVNGTIVSAPAAIHISGGHAQRVEAPRDGSLYRPDVLALFPKRCKSPSSRKRSMRVLYWRASRCDSRHSRLPCRGQLRPVSHPHSASSLHRPQTTWCCSRVTTAR